MLAKLYKVPYSSFDDIITIQDMLPFFVDYDKKPIVLTPEHNLINAYWMSEFCRLAYITSKGFIEDECKKIGMEVAFFWKDDTEIIVVHNDELIIVACRGTETSKIGDILTDIQFTRAPAITHGTIHSGFKKALAIVWDDLQQYILENCKNKMLFITGHSLGAGLASLIASRVGGAALYTFGSPRVGNEKFALFMCIRIPHYRYVNAGDPISGLPPPLFGWRHFGDVHQFTADIFYKYSPRSFGFSSFIHKRIVKRILMLLTLGKWVMLDLVAEHNVLSFNNYLRWQVNLPPHKIPDEYIKKIEDD